MNIESFAKLLQFSISPIALISGASLLLLSITNRLGRIIDRARILVRELQSNAVSPFNDEDKIQLRILLRRSRFLRWAVLCITASIFLSGLMIIGVFLQVFIGWELKLAILGFLFLSILFLCAAVVFFFLEISMSLQALQLEVGRHI